MKKYILAIFLIIVSLTINAQSYEKNFSKNGINRFMTIDIINDSTLILCGQTSAGVGNDDAIISLMKSDGTMISHQVFGRIGRDYIYDSEIDVTKGNLIFGGNTMESANSADNFFTGVYDLNSNTIQMQSYVGNPIDDDQFRRLCYTSDDYILAVGEISQSNAAAIVKMDTLGNIIWQKVHNYGLSSLKSQFRDIVEIPGQGYMISGFTDNNNSGNYQPTLTLMNNNGIQQWSLIYTDGSIGLYSWQPMVYTSDGGFIIASDIKNGSHDDILIKKLNAQGIVQWAKRYGGIADENIFFLKEVANNEFVFGGRTASYGQGDDAFMTKIDNQGNIIWSRAFGTVGVVEGFWDAEQYINGTDTGFYAVGQAWYNSSTVHAYLVKIKNDGSGLDCHAANAPFTVQNRTITTINGGSFTNWSGTITYTMAQSTTTFNESGRTCLYIDLDSDNSSTATGADYDFGNVCNPGFVLVADNDAYIDNADPVDSVQIFISNGIINNGNEILTNSNNFGLTIQGNNSTNLTLVRNGNNATTDFENALKNIQYQNNATNIVAGIRTITVIAYSGSVSSNVAYATFEILPTNIFVDLGNDTTICQGETLLLDATTMTANNYLWQDSSTNSTFTVTQTGTYYIEAMNNCQFTASDTIEVQITPTQLVVNLGNDTILCIGQSLVLDATNATAESYLWQDGSTNSTFSVTQAGIYIVAVSDTCVTIYDTINVIVTGNLPIVDLGNDTTLCEGETMILDGFSPIANTYLWNDGSTNSTLSVNLGGEYTVETTNNCGTTSDTISIQLLISELELDLGNDTTLCSGDILQLNAFNPTALTYQWQDGSLSTSFGVNQTGNYHVTISDICTTISDSIFIEYINLSVDLGNDTAICEGRSFVVDAYHRNAENYLWQDNQTQPTYTIQGGGTYHVSVTNHCETITDTIRVIESKKTPLLLNLGANQILCPGQVVVLDATTENALYYVWQDSTQGAIYTVNQAGIYEVMVSNACFSITESIEFTTESCCNIFIPNGFTPNEDGNNDIFYAYTNCQVSDFSMMIFDRWGNQLFESTDINEGWNGMARGEIMNTGVYVCIVSFRDGFTNRKVKNSVTLIR